MSALPRPALILSTTANLRMKLPTQGTRPLLFLAASMCSHAIVIIEDDFDSETLGNTTGTNQTIGSTPFRTRNSLNTEVVSPHAAFTSASGNALQLKTSSSTGGGYGAISPAGGEVTLPVALSNGDLLRVSFDMYVQNVPASSSNVEFQLRPNGNNDGVTEYDFVDLHGATPGDVMTVVADFVVGSSGNLSTSTTTLNTFIHFDGVNNNFGEDVNIAQIDNLKFEVFDPTSIPTVLTSDDFNFRSNGNIYPNNGSANQGGTNQGDIIVRPGFNLSTVSLSPATDFLFRWTDLDLDGLGGNNDFVDFTVRATSGTSDDITFGGEGIAIDNNGSGALDPGETLTFEIVDVQLSANTAGSVNFDGFIGAGFFASGNNGGGTTTGEISCSLNGNPATVNLNGTGYTNATTHLTFGSPALSAVFSNIVHTPGTISPNGRARDFDLKFTYTPSGGAFTGLPPHGITMSPDNQDLDANGLPDVWEALYSAQGVDPTGDSDGDGLTNAQESLVGTDPFDPYSTFAFEIAPMDANNVTLAWTYLPSRTGNLQSSTDLGVSAAWTPHSGSATLSNGMWQLDTPTNLDANFFRVESSADDVDGDGVPDWLEPLLGFSNAAGASQSAYQDQSYDTTGDGNADTFVSGDLAAFNEIYRTPETGKSMTRAQAARLLIQTTFGPASMSQVDYVASIGVEAWLDEQIARTSTLTQPYINAIKDDLQAAPQYDWTSSTLSGYQINGGGGGNPYVGGPNYQTAWMRSSLQGEDQLRQRVAFALSQILVASKFGANLGNQPRSIANYYDMMIEGAFGNFEDLLLDVSLHPLMGNYLSHLENQVADPSIGRYPDENYAREIMQLFSIGLWELNPDGTQKLDSNDEPIPTYNNTDITNLAEVFTGVGYAANNFGGGWREDGDSANQYMTTPMKLFASHHDWTAKNIPIGVDSNGNRLYHTIPANPTGDDVDALAEVATVVNQLVNHPNCAPFICRQLIQFLVTSNPSPDYVQRVASVFSNNGSGVTGDMEAVIKALYLDVEARNPLNHLKTAYFGHFREPTIRTVHLARMLKLDQYNELLWWDWGYYNDQSLQEPMASPSVFNYYRPDFSLFGTLAENELDSPALGIVNSYSSISFTNYLWKICDEGFEQHGNAHQFWDDKKFPPDFTELETLASNVPNILDHLSILFCGGTLSAESRAIITPILQSEPDLTDRARLAVFLVLIAPEGSCLK
ncbi:MAG: DUF1800 family protein [Roseibacillus sp.]